MRGKQKPKFRVYEDSDGSILIVNVGVTPRALGVVNGRSETTFYMYPAMRGKERCEVSSFTIGVLREIGPRPRGNGRKSR